jgi:hypothetical protein
MEQDMQALRTALEVSEARLELAEQGNAELSDEVQSLLRDRSAAIECSAECSGDARAVNTVGNVGSVGSEESAVVVEEIKRVHKMEKCSWAEREKAYQIELKLLQSELRGVKAKVVIMLQIYIVTALFTILSTV